MDTLFSKSVTSVETNYIEALRAYNEAIAKAERDLAEAVDYLVVEHSEVLTENEVLYLVANINVNTQN